MNITKEMLEKQANGFIQNNEGVKQGYIAALQWIASVLDQKDEVAPIDQPKS